MQNNFNDEPNSTMGDTEASNESSERNNRRNRASGWMQSLLQMGLGESFLRAATNVFSAVAILVVIWIAQAYFLQPGSKVRASGGPLPGPTPAAGAPSSASFAPLDLSSVGILRQANVHTNAPGRPRQDIVLYTVQAGDTVSGIADKYGLQPKTVFAANYEILQDNPDYLQPGQQLKILPVDGVYWEWLGGISFSEWAEYFKVKPEDILNFPANKLNPNAVGDPTNPNIKVGTFLIIPGGEYQYHTPGQIPLGITRNNPATAQVGGPGACPPVNGGAVGYGTFVYPTAKHVLSGYGYDTKTNHLGLDLMGGLGDPVYATDGGVVVYAGWNEYGYGNLIMVDHGTGFQSLYAHLSQIFVQCGQSVSQGQTIGAIGSTGRSSGPHLHFEIRTASTVINPWDVLPPP